MIRFLFITSAIALLSGCGDSTTQRSDAGANSPRDSGGFNRDTGIIIPDASTNADGSINRDGGGPDGGGLDGGSTTDGAVLDGSTADGGTIPRAECDALAAECRTRCAGSFASVECTGPLSGSYTNVTVNQGSCELSNALITGNLIVNSGASAEIGSSVFVCGSIIGEQALDLSSLPTADAFKVCTNFQSNQTDGIDIEAGMMVSQNAQVVGGTVTAIILEATICGNAEFSTIEELEITGSVVGNCTATGNDEINFMEFQVFGTNNGCL